jgi:hypothetical protein
MNISSIRESGSNNLLKWAINNKVDLKNHSPLASLINDELFFLVNIDNVNFYDVYRLTQLYRNKLRIRPIHTTREIPETELADLFLPENVKQVSDTIEQFISLTTQMVADNDIIQEGCPRLFIPMITSTYDIQIPLSFIDVLDMLSSNEVNELFTPDYPATLNHIPDEDKFIMLKSAIYITIQKNTADIKYNDKYEKLINTTKYFPLKAENNQIFKCGLIGFSKFDNIARSQIKCNLFNADKSDIESKMHQMSRLKTPLELEFAIQLPIYYMNTLEASYYPEDLKISYRSSISNIINNGMVFHNFKINEDESNETEIDAYKVRISEANHDLLKTLDTLIQSRNIGSKDLFGSIPNGIFSLLPPIYLTNAVITITDDTIPQFLNTSDDVLYALFKNIENVSRSVIQDIQALK